MSAILLRVMSQENFFGSNLQIWNKPTKNQCRSESSEELREYEPWNVNGLDADKRVA